MVKVTTLLLLVLFPTSPGQKIFLPIDSPDRKSIETISLTDIGTFGLMRKARPSVAEHFHTGIDIKRPSRNYDNEPIFPAMQGTVISIRRDGAYAQVIIEHALDAKKVWTVYEHIAGINVRLYQPVSPAKPIARFMNKMELNRYGWQFDHFHFEVLKVTPIKVQYNKSHPERLFNSYTLLCHSRSDLIKYFYEPLEFLKEGIAKK